MFFFVKSCDPLPLEGNLFFLCRLINHPNKKSGVCRSLSLFSSLPVTTTLTGDFLAGFVHQGTIVGHFSCT
jgi:hypothetical protein